MRTYCYVQIGGRTQVLGLEPEAYRGRHVFVVTLGGNRLRIAADTPEAAIPQLRKLLPRHGGV